MPVIPALPTSTVQSAAPFGRLLNQPLTIRHRAGAVEDDYGNTLPGNVATTETLGYVEQVEAEEFTVGRETYRADWKVFLPAGVDVDGSDRIEYGDRTFEVIGPPHEVWNPRTRGVHHVELRARQVTG